MKKEMTASEMGRKGGMTTLKRYGKKKMKEWASKAGIASKMARDKAKLEQSGGVNKLVDSTNR